MVKSVAAGKTFAAPIVMVPALIVVAPQVLPVELMVQLLESVCVSPVPAILMGWPAMMPPPMPFPRSTRTLEVPVMPPVKV